MKRRLALARVALSQTKLWILDEPFYGLDQRALGIFQLMLRDHLASGGAALVVSHDLAPLEKYDHQTIQLESFKDGVR
jgi:heme exporter protein A